MDSVSEEDAKDSCKYTIHADKMNLVGPQPSSARGILETEVPATEKLDPEFFKTGKISF